MELDAVMLARMQFAFTVAFHIIFPSFTIGLSAWIATLLVIWRRTGADHYRDLAKFWTKIFAVSFGMGVVSGIVMSYEFGTNWSHFSHVVGNVVGPLIGYEVLTAFFLEATFLGILLFGWNRVPPGLHVTAAILVFIFAWNDLLLALSLTATQRAITAPGGTSVRNSRTAGGSRTAPSATTRAPCTCRPRLASRLSEAPAWIVSDAPGTTRTRPRAT